MLILIYLGLNQTIELVREIIQFRSPLLCFARSLMFLGVSAVATIVGDMNIFWLVLFMGF